MNAYEKLCARLVDAPRAWLVTGAAGFIGSHLIETLLKLGQRVTGLDNFSLGSAENIAAVQESVTAAQWRRFHLLKADVRDPDACRNACTGVQIVLHQAALGSVPRSLADPIASHANNVSGHLNMLHAAREAGVDRFVYASSSAIYGDDPELPRVEARIGRPLSPYALTKRLNEMYADVYARCFGYHSIGLRYFNVFGPRQNPAGPYAAVIPAWIGAMLRGDPVCINGDGSAARDFCYVENAVQANLLAATVENPRALDESYNVALNAMTSLNELFELLRALLEPHHPHLRAFEPTHGPTRPGDVAYSKADIGKSVALLGYRPQWSLREGLARTVDWYAAHAAPGLVPSVRSATRSRNIPRPDSLPSSSPLGNP
jgi:UDP-N-acetylglucosamine 4-epimerase